MSSSRGNIYRFGAFELNAEESRLTLAGREIEIEPKVFDCLLMFVRRSGQLVSKRELLDAIWPDTNVNEEALAQAIHKLRRSLGDSPESPRFLQTVRKRGFRFLPVVSEELAGAERQSPMQPVNPAVTLAAPNIPVTTTYLTNEVSAKAQTGDSPELVVVEHGATPIGDSPRRPIVARRRTLLLIAGLVFVAVGLSALLLTRRGRDPKGGGEFPNQQLILKVDASQVLRRMTFFPERDEDARFAPDGQSFVFVSKHDGSGLFRLYAARTAPSTPVRVTRAEGVEEQTPSFSPDGQWIAYTRNEAGRSEQSIWKTSTLGGEEGLVVTNAALPTWSPDSRELIYVRTLGNGERTVMRSSLDGSSEHEILRWPQRVDGLEWSPEGSQVVLWSNHTIWIFPAEGGKPRRLTDEGIDGQTPSWTPDAKAVLCAANWGGHHHVWMVPVNGDPPVPITSGVGPNVYPSMSRDRRRLLYTHESWQRQVWEVDRRGRNPQIVPTKTTFLTVALDPLGKFLAYSDYELASHSTAASNELGVMNLETREHRGLGAGTHPAFSPDGKRLVVQRKASAEGHELWVVELQTGAGRRVAPAVSEPIVPAWSPDGSRVVFQRAGKEGAAGLSIVEVENGRVSLLAGGIYRAPAWSPDGRVVAAVGTSREGRGLYLIDVESGQARRISEKISYEAAPVWSADSRTLTILVDERTRPTLVTLDRSGVELSRMVLEVPPDPSFWGVFEFHELPGKGWLYILQRVEGDIYMLDFPALAAS